MEWSRLNGDKIEISLLDAVESTLLREKEAGHRLKVCIGSDSQVYGENIEFATVIVFLREKRGGFMFISNYRITQKMTLKERMIADNAEW